MQSEKSLLNAINKFQLKKHFWIKTVYIKKHRIYGIKKFEDRHVRWVALEIKCN